MFAMLLRERVKGIVAERLSALGGIGSGGVHVQATKGCRRIRLSARFAFQLPVNGGFQLRHVAAFSIHAVVQHAMAVGTDGSQVFQATLHFAAQLTQRNNVMGFREGSA